jgi:hypothetical protein
MIGAAAQKTQPARIQRNIALAAQGAGIHFLGLGIEILATGFQQQDVNLVSANARARLMPAGPPPMMARSGSSIVAVSSVRASIKPVKSGIRGGGLT